MLCLFKTHALGLFSDPGPVETKTAFTDSYTLCAVTSVDLMFS